MIVLFDHLSSMLIGLALLGLLVVTQMRGSNAQIEQTVTSIAKQQTFELSEMLTRELSNVGASMPAGQRLGKVYNVPHAGADSTEMRTDTLQFWRKDKDGLVQNIRYVLTFADTVEVGDERVPTYALRRYQNGAYTGESAATLTLFRVEPLDARGDDVGGNLSQTRQLRITLVNAFPYQLRSRMNLRQTYWTTTLRPRSLR